MQPQLRSAPTRKSDRNSSKTCVHNSDRAGQPGLAAHVTRSQYTAAAASFRKNSCRSKKRRSAVVLCVRMLWGLVHRQRGVSEMEREPKRGAKRGRERERRQQITATSKFIAPNDGNEEALKVSATRWPRPRPSAKVGVLPQPHPLSASHFIPLPSPRPLQPVFLLTRQGPRKAVDIAITGLRGCSSTAGVRAEQSRVEARG